MTGVKEAVTPVGNPEIERLTAPVNPYSGVMVMMDVPLLPGLIPRLVGEGVRTKVGAWTARVTVVVTLRLPEVPVIVRGVVEPGACWPP